MIVLLFLFLLIVIPALVAFLSDSSVLPRPLLRPVFGVGAPVVYQRQEVSTRPHPDARDVQPSERGEFYYCTLVNYLRVTHVLDDGEVIAIAPDNRRFCFRTSDSQFRKARLTERIFYRWRFPQL